MDRTNEVLLYIDGTVLM